MYTNQGRLKLCELLINGDLKYLTLVLLFVLFILVSTIFNLRRHNDPLLVPHQIGKMKSH